MARSPGEDAHSLLEANRRFYDAFASLEVQSMEGVWERSDRVTCIHPGWRILVGWPRVRESWAGIFDNSTLMHFTITYARVFSSGDLGVVSCTENISSVVDGRASNFAVQATNVFVRGPEAWLMVHHQASG